MARYDDAIKVKVPKDSIIYTIGGKKYAYITTKKVYRKDKKNNSDKRIPIGRLTQEDESMMYPNGNFKIYFKAEYDALELPKLESDKLHFSDAIHYGLTGSFITIAKDLNLFKLLQESIDDGTNKDFGKIVNTVFNLAFKFVITENSSFVGYPYFARNHLILGGDIHSDSTVGNILKEVNQKQVRTFMERWLKTHQTEKGMLISCDGTNVISNSDDIELVDLGHNKNGSFENQISYTLLTDQNVLRPLFLEEYNGSTHDVEAIKPILAWLKQLDIKNVNILVDRGYFSKKLMKTLLTQGNGFVMMAKLNNEIKEIIDSYEKEIKSYQNYIKSLDLNGFTVVRKLFKDLDNCVDFHIFYNSNYVNQCERELKKKVKDCCEILNAKLKKSDNTFDKSKYEKYFDLTCDENGSLIAYSIKEDAIKDELKYVGYFVICTSFSETTEAAYYLYHNRDYTEKLIRMMKTNEEFDVCRVHSEKSLIAKNLSMFIGLILRNELFVRTKQLRDKTKDKKLYTTTHVIKELSCIQAVMEKSGKYFNLRALTNCQKTILSALGITEKQLQNSLNTFNSHF